MPVEEQEEITTSGDCEHASVDWNPVEMDYQTDGTAAVWQEGRCKNCHALVQLNYGPSGDGIEVIPGADSEEEDDEEEQPCP